MRKRVNLWQKRHEAHANRVLAVLAAVIVSACLIGAIAVPVAHAYESNRCDPTFWGHDVRNSYVYPNTTPECDGGIWVVTTPREAMPEDAYGFNCYMDGDGICGALEVLDDNCLTDLDDGYTMCATGDVYYRDAAGGKLWPVKRDPR